MGIIEHPAEPKAAVTITSSEMALSLTLRAFQTWIETQEMAPRSEESEAMFLVADALLLTGYIQFSITPKGVALLEKTK